MATIPADVSARVRERSRPLLGRPRVRRDVQAFEDAHDGCVLRSHNGREFRLGRGERLVVQLLDGTRRPADVCRQLYAAHGVRCDPRLVERFVTQLDAAGLLANGREDDARPIAFERRGMLYIVRLIAPDPWLRQLVARFQWIDRWIVSTVVIALTVTAACIIAANHAEIGARIADAWSTRALLVALGLAVIAALVHESLHAVTAVSYGARVTSAGCGLYWFRPCLFCEIRGLESLPWGHRMVVSGAGAIGDLLHASTYLVLWRVLPPGTLAAAALLTATLLGVRILINLNPLVKLDGYFLLADAIGRPDLRESAFAELRRWLRGLTSMPFGGGKRSRLRVGEAIYALLAIAYAAGLAVVIGLTMRNWIAAHVQQPAIVFAMLIVFGLASLTERTLWGGRRRGSVRQHPP